MLSIELSDAALFTALLLAFTHFSIPLAYYCYLKSRWLSRSWGIRRDPGYRPRVSIVIPTYNEAGLIQHKLDNVVEQNYPQELLEVIVVDSASSDGTAEAVKKWIDNHRGVRVVLIEEPVRRGKGFALNIALRYVSSEIVVVTDADSLWPSRDVLANAVSWFADPAIGAVTCIKSPAGKGFAGVEQGYREFYNVVRVGESKKFSTPVFHGELAAFRKDLLLELGGFPTDIGADDSYTATLIALRGYRAIAVDNALCVELVPRKGYHMWRIRRAQHLVQHFAKVSRHLFRAPKEFRCILLAEAYLHLANPWLLLASVITLLYSAANGSALAVALLALGILLLLYKPFRTWVATQLYLAIATVRNLWTREIVWVKHVK